MHVTVFIKHLHYYKLNIIIEKQGKKPFGGAISFQFKINYRFY